MSHYTTIKVKLHENDIDALKMACKELGLEFGGKGRVRFYYDRNQVTADYVIKIPGCPYDVGLQKDPITGDLTLVYDKYEGLVEKVLGVDCAKLVQSTVYNKIAKQAKLKGYFVAKRVEKDSVFVEIKL